MSGLRERLRSSIRRFAKDKSGASAVEFAILAMPFFLLLLGVIQLGIFYMTQSALNSGVLNTAELLRNRFAMNTTAPDIATLKANVVSTAGGLIDTGSTAFEVRQLSALTAGPVAIADGTSDFGGTTSTLVLRARATALTFVPGLGTLNVVTSSALVRRRGT